MAIRNFMDQSGGGSGTPLRKSPSAAFTAVKTMQPIQTQSSPSSFPKAGGVIQPVQNYTPTYSPPVQQSPIQQGVNAGSGAEGFNGGAGGMGGGASVARSPMQFSDFTDDMAATDSIFTDQKSAYANALKKFIEDNDRQRGILNQDASTAQAGIKRNRTNGLTGLSEDFASRGLSNSGMFSQELETADNQYDKQGEQVAFGLKNATDDLGFRKAKYDQENGENGTNIQAARREAFARLAASQGLT